MLRRLLLCIFFFEREIVFKFLCLVVYKFFEQWRGIIFFIRVLSLFLILLLSLKLLEQLFLLMFEDSFSLLLDGFLSFTRINALV